MESGHEVLMTVQETADFLRLSAHTLNAWRWKKIGPPFTKYGHNVWYKRSVLLRWVDDHAVETSDNLIEPP
jgi:hypothetical protein